MFELRNKVEGVKGYYLSGKYLLTIEQLSNDDRLFRFVDTNNLEELWQSKIDFKSLYITYETNHSFLGYESNQKIFDLNKKDGALRIKGIKFVPEAQFNGRIYGRYTNESGDKFVSRLDIQTLEIENLITGLYRLIGASSGKVLLVTPGKGIISCLDIEVKSILWEFDVKCRISGAVYTVRDQVIIGTSDHKFSSLNSKTGEILWQSEGVPYLKPYGEILYGLDVLGYTEIDPKTGKIIKQINLEDQYKVLGIQNSAASYTVVEDYIYFNDVRKAKVGILEKATGNIIWTFKLPVKDGVTIPASNVPQVHENRMYVLDSEGTLHVFEKE